MSETQEVVATVAEGEAPAGEQGDVYRIGRRCYVGNLAWKTSWQDLKDHFRSAGEVVYTNVMRDDSGRSKGWGIVEFSDPQEAVEAVNSLNGTDLGGRKVLVREDREDRDVKEYNRENGVEPRERPPRAPRAPGGGGRGGGRGRGPPPPREGQSSGLQVVVQGLPWKYTWKDLKPMFEECGTVAHADVVFGRDGRSRGYGLVRFEDEAGANAAIEQYHGRDLEGRTLTVKLDQYA